MSNATLHVKPAAGLTVRDPNTGHALPAAGQRVPHNTYWRRRLAAGDVTRVTKKPARAKAKRSA